MPRWLANFATAQIVEFCTGLLLFLAAQLSLRLPLTKHRRLLLWAQFTFLTAGICLIVMSLLHNNTKPLGYGLLGFLAFVAVSITLGTLSHARDKRRRISTPPPVGAAWPPPPSEWEYADDSVEED